LRLWLARLLIGLVIAWNLQAAIVFLVSPGAYAPGFELSGVAGVTAMRGIAVLFIMWNVPYILAAWHPQRNLLSLKEALVMQSTGLIGETWLLLSLGSGHATLQTSIQRFVLFDAAGLLSLALAFWLATAKK
jgi:hypothetical protein